MPCRCSSCATHSALALAKAAAVGGAASRLSSRQRSNTVSANSGAQPKDERSARAAVSTTRLGRAMGCAAKPPVKQPDAMTKLGA